LSQRDENTGDGEHRLSKRPKVKFIPDVDTNSILVAGADTSQLRTIEDLIKIYDQPPPRDSQTDRKTEVFRLRYAKVSTVADPVKDVYRDLLSANDKALATGNQGPQENRRMFIFSYDDSDKSEQKKPKPQQKKVRA